MEFARVPKIMETILDRPFPATGKIHQKGPQRKIQGVAAWSQHDRNVFCKHTIAAENAVSLSDSLALESHIRHPFSYNFWLAPILVLKQFVSCKHHSIPLDMKHNMLKHGKSRFKKG